MIRCVIKSQGEYLNKRDRWGAFSRARIFYTKKHANKHCLDVGGKVVEVNISERGWQPQKPTYEDKVWVATYLSPVDEDVVIAVGEVSAVRKEAEKFMSDHVHSKMGFDFNELKDWPDCNENVYSNKWNETVTVKKIDYSRS